MSVCTAIDSAPGHAIESRPVSVEPVGSKKDLWEKKFPEKSPVTKLPKKTYAANTFLWGNFKLPFFMNGLLG